MYCKHLQKKRKKIKRWMEGRRQEEKVGSKGIQDELCTCTILHNEYRQYVLETPTENKQEWKGNLNLVFMELHHLKATNTTGLISLDN